MTTAAIGVVGAGTMGSGIALALADAGHRAIVVDTSAEALARSAAFVASRYAELRLKGRIDDAQAATRAANIIHTADFAALADCSPAIEAVFESLELKRRVFGLLAATCGPDAITVWRLGYGFPAARGGPMQYGRGIGFQAVAARIDDFAQADPAFRRVARYVRERARAEGGSAGKDTVRP